MLRKNEWPLLVLIAAVGIGSWNLNLPAPLQPYLAASLGISLGAAAQVVTVSAAAAIITLLLYGLYDNRFGLRIPPKYFIWGGLASLTFGSWLASQTDSYRVLLVIRVFNGIADGVIYPASWVAIASYLKPERWGFGNKWIIAGTALSAVIGLPLVNIWASQGGWESSFQWFTLAGAAMFLLSLTLQLAEETPQEPKAGGFQRIWSDSYLRGLLVSNMFVAASWFGVITFVGGFIVRTYLPTTSQISWFFVVAGLAFITSSIVIYSDKRSLQRRISLASGAAAAGFAFIFFAWTPGFWVTVALGAVFASTRAPGFVAMETMLIEDMEEKKARVSAITSVEMVNALGTFIGAAIGGIVLSSATYAAIGGIFTIFSALGCLFLIRTYAERKVAEPTSVLIQERKT